MAFELNEEWKERIVYREANQSFTFDCAWGVKPFIVYVPTAAYWKQATPEWMHGRRNEILDRLHSFVGSRYAIKETDEGYSTFSPEPWVTVLAASHRDRSVADGWIAVLMDANETTTPNSSWPEEDRARFFYDHAGRIGSGKTPHEAVDDLKHRLGQPELRWGT